MCSVVTSSCRVLSVKVEPSAKRCESTSIASVMVGGAAVPTARRFVQHYQSSCFRILERHMLFQASVYFPGKLLDISAGQRQTKFCTCYNTVTTAAEVLYPAEIGKYSTCKTVGWFIYNSVLYFIMHCSLSSYLDCRMSSKKTFHKIGFD